MKDVGAIVREIVTFFNLWFDILEENGLPFIEKTANRLDKTTNRLEKTANCLLPESMFSVLGKTANRLEKMANSLFTESNLFDILE